MTTYSLEVTLDGHTQAPPLTDGCPVCVVHYLRPTSTEALDGGVRAWYRHRRCGHRWYTSWATNTNDMSRRDTRVSHKVAS